MTEPHEHGLGHVDLGGTKEPSGEIHSLPEGSVLAADGSTISWSRAADGTLTALGHNEQLVISRYRPSKTAGTDVLHGGDVTAGAVGPTDTGASAGGPLAGGGADNLDVPSPVLTSDGAPDPISGMRLAYSTVGQGDPWLRLTTVIDESEQTFFIEIVGVLASATFHGTTAGGDATNVPVKVAATYLPHHESVNWEGALDVTRSPVQTIVLIPGWRLDAFKNETSGAAYFDPLTDVVVAAFPPPDSPELGPGVAAQKSGAGVFGRAAIACVGGAIGGGLAGGPTAPLLAVGGCFLAADVSMATDLWSSVTDDITEVKPEAPDLSDIPVDPEEPDSGCFAAGTAVALPGRQSVPIENIAVGDLVASREESSLNEGGKRVTRTWEHPMKRTVDVSLDTGERVRTTSPHRFFTLEEGIVSASELKVGQQLRTLAGPPRTIVGIEPGPPTVTVYNVTVEGFHTYFVGDAALWVHNEKSTSPDDPPPPPPPGGDDPAPDDPGGGTDEPTPDDPGAGGADPVPA